MAKAQVIGLGKSGIAAAQLLNEKGWDVTASDRNTGEALRQLQLKLEAEGIEVLLGRDLEPEPSLKLVVVSPGVPWDSPALVRAREMGIETIGEMEFAWRNLQSCPWISITGTNGKTTTTALIAAIFQTAGFHAPACGNIGYAACELAREQVSSSNTKPLDFCIAEISSYQVEASSSLAPDLGIWTTFTPDHLSRHHTLENYFQIKASLLHRSKQQVLNGDDPYLRDNCAQLWPNACWTSVKGKEFLFGDTARGVYIEAGWVVSNGVQVVPVDALRMPGEHNRQNLLMAVAAAVMSGISTEAIARAIAEFPGVTHRLEFICSFSGVDFINDSKATNYDAAQVGLASVEAPAILIAGGDPKEGDDRAWLQTIEAKVAKTLLIGEAAPAFAQRWQEVGNDRYEIVETMERAVNRAAVLARELEARVVLLSPACASFDQYKNFEQRGEHFRQLCLELLA